jgi:hypothetical protein
MRCLQVEAYLENLSPTDYDQDSVSPATEEYNCIAWAAGRTDRPWWPSKEEPYYYHWPDGLEREEAGKETLSSFIKAFQSEGYEICADGGLEDGIEKVALFGSPGIFWGRAIGWNRDQRRAYSRGPGESVTRSDRRGRERWLGGSAPPLAGPREWDGAGWVLDSVLGVA